MPLGRRTVLRPINAPTSAEALADAPTIVLSDEGQLSLGEDHVVLVRLHPFVRSDLALPPDLAGFAIDVSDYPDIPLVIDPVLASGRGDDLAGEVDVGLGDCGDVGELHDGRHRGNRVHP